MKYLFSYPYPPGRYSFEVEADNETEAKDRVKAMASATYDGIVGWRIYVPKNRWTVSLANLQISFMQWIEEHRRLK